MEQERLAREKEEEDKKAKVQKIKEEFGDAASQWEKDKADLSNLAVKQQREAAAKEAEKPKKPAAVDGAAGAGGSNARADGARVANAGGGKGANNAAAKKPQVV
jgi:mannan polymerase II complex ANP1 subunit